MIRNGVLRRLPEARPHPDLLPEEKGQRLGASRFADTYRANPVVGIFKEAATYSPSPEGEGRGESGWDGTYKGQPVQQGVYIYLITVEDYNGKKSYFKGTITMFE